MASCFPALVFPLWVLLAEACQQTGSLEGPAGSTTAACGSTRGTLLLQLGSENRTSRVANNETSSLRPKLFTLQLHDLLSTRLFVSRDGAHRTRFAIGTGDDLSITWIIVVIMLVSCLSVVVLSWFGDHHDPLSQAVRSGVDNFGERCLGVDLDVESTKVSTIHGWIELRGLVMNNPPGFVSPYLLKVDRVLVDLDTQELWSQCLRPDKITVSEVAISGVDFIYESKVDGIWPTSNVDELLKILETRSDKSQPQPSQPQSQQEGASVSLLKVDVQDVKIRLQAEQLMGASLPVHVANMQYEDFSKEFGVHAVGDAALIILRSLLKTVHAQVFSSFGGMRRAATSCC
eukprot:TRINITY_DN95599_c0_g1_i1.p1 TRINITY_DN95599_c0_g1~~TRINITY_DN95599_c0_g1_i1.p1  ORF type:complete len:346 (-),score=39.23 TRINITY_DN95599_c0_g1_i1:2-1039(-)